MDSQITNQSFQRTVGNISNTIDNNQLITNSKIEVKLDIIKYNYKTSYKLKNLTKNNPYIGTIDLETYYDKDLNMSKVYALGFYTKPHGPHTFYINEDLNSEDIIIKCFESLIVTRYNKYTFYAHNLGRYDIIFILKTLLKSDKYEFETTCRDNLVLCLTIYDKTNRNSIRLVDSYKLLPHSLRKLGEAYGTEIVKDIFTYKFVNKNTLFYSGSKPTLDDYEIRYSKI